MNLLTAHRNFLKDSLRKTLDFRNSDQHRGVPAPPVSEPADEKQPRIQLPEIDKAKAEIPKIDLVAAIDNRRSRRRYSNTHLSLAELTFLLWATQGIRKNERSSPSFRTVPSAGARHSFETYLLIKNVLSVPKGIYRYLPIENELVLVKTDKNIDYNRITKATFGQRFIAEAPVVFLWTTVPYRTEWRYMESAHRVILLDAGHVCQNLYLACEAIGAGTCAVAAYDQEMIDELLGVDGNDQFTIYLAPVGHV